MEPKSVKIEKQNKFPYIGRYKNKFPIDENTIFIFDDTIFTNNELPYDILFHEIRHLKQQQHTGPKQWVDNYLSDDGFRLGVELDAYKEQLRAVKKMGDKQEYAYILMECARNISSPLYGNIITYQDAIKYFKKHV